MLDITVRPYIPSDYGRICEIHDAARKIELSLSSLDSAFVPFSEAADREGFFDYPHIDAAIIDNNIVGFSAYTDEELAWLYVAPDMMRKGIGKSLVKRALEVEPNIAYVEALYGNEPAKNMYESFGFRVREIAEGRMPGNEKFRVRVYCMYRKL